MKIAVIGGIGSGKSAVMEAFKEEGFTVLSADQINNELWQTDAYLETLKINFPEAVVDGIITKANLGKVVFADESKREQLNSISHPLIVSRIEECNDKNIAVELPLALESGIMDKFDKVILVDTKRSLRLKRLEGRGVDKKRAKRIMTVQVPIRTLKKMADVIITNNGTVDELRVKSRAKAKALKN